MPQINSQLQLGRRTLSDRINYTESVSVVQEVDNADEFITLVSFSQTKGTNVMSGSKGFFIYNRSKVGAEIMVKIYDWKNNSNVDEANSVDLGPDSATAVRNISFLLPANRYMFLPNARVLSYAEYHSAGNGTSVDNAVPPAVTYLDSAVTLGADLDVLDTELTVSDNQYFKVGDLLQIGIAASGTTQKEIVKVTALTDNSGVASTTKVQVDRAQFGTSKIDNGSQTDGTSGCVNGAKVYFPFFNATKSASLFGGYATPQTDKQGRFHSYNFFGIGRTADAVADGIVPGSVALKFYSQPFAEFGLKGISANSDSGLTAGNTYYFTISVDGSSAYEVTLVVDASNTKFGGANGIINKLQAIFDTQYSTGGSNLLNKGVTVGIVNGDLRITSHSRLTTSDVTITAGSSGSATSNLIANALGVFPASTGNKQEPKLADDILRDKATYDSVPNVSQFAYDDGNGVISGAAQGTINYETGEINFTGPSESNFVYSATHKSAHSGGVETSGNYNNIESIGARSCNQKVPANIEILGYN